MSYETVKEDFERARWAFVDARDSLVRGGLVSDGTRDRLLATGPEGMKALAMEMWKESKNKVALAILETVVPAAERMMTVGESLKAEPRFVEERDALQAQVMDRLAHEELAVAKAVARAEALHAVIATLNKDLFNPDIDAVMRPLMEEEKRLLDDRKPPDEVDIARYQMVKDTVREIAEPAKPVSMQEIGDFVDDEFRVDVVDVRQGNVIIKGGGIITPESVAEALCKRIRNAEFPWQRTTPLERLDRWTELTGRDWQAPVDVPEWMAVEDDGLNSVMQLDGFAIAIHRGHNGWKASPLEDTGYATDEYLMAVAIRDGDFRDVHRLADQGVEISDDVLAFVGRTAEDVSDEFGIEVAGMDMEDVTPPDEPAAVERPPAPRI